MTYGILFVCDENNVGKMEEMEILVRTVNIFKMLSYNRLRV